MYTIFIFLTTDAHDPALKELPRHLLSVGNMSHSGKGIILTSVSDIIHVSIHEYSNTIGQPQLRCSISHEEPYPRCGELRDFPKFQPFTPGLLS